jgi:hypothetical protein
MEADWASTRRELIASLGLGTMAGKLGGSRPASQLANDLTEPKQPTGAIADGGFHRMGERFTSLVEARQLYPAAFSLDQSIDHAAIQTALDMAEADRGVVDLPVGRYVLSHSLKLPSFVSLRGANAILDNQNHPLAVPLIVNKDPTHLIFSSIRDIGLRGGSHGVKIEVSGETAGLMFENVTFELQTDTNFECNQLLQLADFTRCTFDTAPSGLVVRRFTTNAVNFYACSFTNHSRSHLHLRSGEAVNFFGGRFEGGGNPGAGDTPPSTIDIEDVRNLNFFGTYFEGTHEILLRERRSGNSVTFAGCHFTGGKTGKDLIPYKFDSDGIVHFGTNSWTVASAGARRMMITGDNGEKFGDGSATVYHARTSQHVSLTGPIALMRAGTALAFALVPAPGAQPTGAAIGVGELSVVATSPMRTPHKPRIVARHFQLSVRRTGTAIEAFLDGADGETSPKSRAIDIALSRGADGQSVLTAMLDESWPDGAEFHWSYRSLVGPMALSPRAIG